LIIKIEIRDKSCVLEKLNAKLFSLVEKHVKLFAVLKCNYIWSAVWQLFSVIRHHAWSMGHLKLLDEILYIFSIFYLNSICKILLCAKFRVECVYQQDDEARDNRKVDESPLKHALWRHSGKGFRDATC